MLSLWVIHCYFLHVYNKQKLLHVSKNGKSERTRHDILDTAWTLIARRGADISLSEIAAAVGITRQSIYVHFGSRGGLLVALVRRADERADIEKKFVGALATKDAKERLEACLDVWLRFVPEIYPVARDLIRLRHGDAEAATAWEDRMTDLRGMFSTLALSLRADHALAAHWTPARAADFMWASSSVESWGLLIQDCGWNPSKAAKSIKYALSRSLLAD